MKSYSPDGADHTQRCLPAIKPKYCAKAAFERLQDVFDGGCPEPSKIPGYKQCILETNNDEMPHCLPFVYKPEFCSKNSWNDIHKKVFQFQ